MNTMLRRIFIVSLLLISSLLATAQGQKTISLEEALSKALSNNLALQRQAVNAKIAQIDAEKANAVFLPHINANYTAMRTNDPLNVFGMKLKQEIVQQSDFAPNLLNNPNHIDNYSATVKVEQPIFNLDGIYMRSAAKAKAVATHYQLERGKEYLTFQIKQMYAQLQLLYAANDVLAKAKETVAANVKLVQDMSKQGYTKPADELEAKVHLTDIENKILDNQINIQNLSDQLYYVMGEKKQETLQPATVIKDIPNTGNILINSTLQLNRADLLAYEAGIKARKQMVRAGRSKFLPRLNAFGQYEINDSKILQADANNYMVGVQLSWSLFNGNQNRKDIQKSKAELEGAELAYKDYVAKSQTELNKAQRDIKNSLAKKALAKKALGQAKESYRIRKNRFQEGLEKTTDLLKDETSVQEKNLSYLQAIFQLQTAVHYLEFLNTTAK